MLFFKRQRPIRFKRISYLTILLLSCFCLFACEAEAEKARAKTQIEEVQIEIEPATKQLSLSAQIETSLSDELENAVKKGVSLYFILELQLYQSRWYYLDKKVFSKNFTWQIQYNALLRQWTVDNGKSIVTEYSLKDSLDHIQGKFLRQIKLDTINLEEKPYYARVRLKLDTSQLSRPFQIRAFNNRSAWAPSSKWQTITLQP